MGDRWQWAGPIRERHFRKPLRDGYTLQRVDEGTYWERHEGELREHFPPEAYFDTELLRGESRGEARERLRVAEGAERLAEHWLVHAADGSLAGVFCTFQVDVDTFELYHVTLHPEH